MIFHDQSGPGDQANSKRELLERLITDYVVAGKREEWLKTGLPAFQGRSPQQLIDAGALDNVIAELWRLEQGLPL